MKRVLLLSTCVAIAGTSIVTIAFGWDPLLGRPEEIIGSVLLTMISVPGWLFVLFLARWLTKRSRGEGSLDQHLTSAHIVLMTTLITCSPILLSVLSGSAEYGDVYLPYVLYPGYLIYRPTMIVSATAFPALLRYMSPRRASIITVIIIPGFIMALALPVWWMVVGRLWRAFQRSK